MPIELVTLPRAMEVWLALLDGKKVVWASSKGKFYISQEDPIGQMFANHIGSGSTVYGFYIEQDN